MPKNMTIFKSPEYSCLQIHWRAKVIDRIFSCSQLIFQPESNKHCTKIGKSKTHHTNTGNQNKQNRAETMKSEKQMIEDKNI